MAQPGRIRVGIGGWNYEPWRETFYPKNITQARELEYASSKVTAIEINGTFYRLQKPAVYAKWRDSTPDDFKFSLKAPRYIVQRKELATAGNALERFLASGLAELGSKLGPVLWQMEPHKHFDAADLEAFLKLLPPTVGDQPLKNVLEVRHKSYLVPEFIDLARRFGAAVVLVDDAKHPLIADITGDFIYVRLRQCEASVETGYADPALEAWAERARTWALGGAPVGLNLVEATAKAAASPREVFVYFINGAKERAPAAAQALIAKLR
jgi:uncharacterized protein YecE (DUF72 family)